MNIPDFFPDSQLPGAVFETFVWDDDFSRLGLGLHLERLKKSAEICQLPVPDFSEEEIFDQLKMIQRPRRIKLRWSRQLEIIQSEFSAENLVDKGAVIDCEFERLWPEAKYETPLYKYIQDQQPSDVVETVFFDSSGYLLEGNITNVFVVSDGVLVTPGKNILHGIFRGKILQKAKELNIPFEIREIHRDEILKASEIFLTNSVRGIISVVKWSDWKSESSDFATQLQKSMKIK